MITREGRPRRTADHMTSVFWNSAEGRLRALWRVLLLMPAVGLQVATVALLFGELMEDPVIQNVVFGGLSILNIFLAAKWWDHRPMGELGMRMGRAWWADFAFGLLLGFLLIAMVFSVEYSQGWVTVTTMLTAVDGGSFFSNLMLTTLVMVVIGFNEELIFRGYLLKNCTEGLSRLPGKLAPLLSALFISSLFGLAHVRQPNATGVSTLNIVLAGILLATPYLITGRLGLSIGLHIAWNFTEGVVFGFPISGTSNWPARFIAIEQSGPERWTGGPFGPEGGLLCLFAMALGFLLVIAWARFREGAVNIAPGIMRLPERADRLSRS